MKDSSNDSTQYSMAKAATFTEQKPGVNSFTPEFHPHHSKSRGKSNFKDVWTKVTKFKGQGDIASDLQRIDHSIFK